MGPAAHEIGSRTNVGDPGDPHNDETPDQIDSGREFRETETDSSGNYPNVGSSRKSLTCSDVA